MDVQMISTTVTPGSSPGSANSSAGTANNGNAAGFGQVLVQALGQAPTAGVAAVLPNLNELLAGLAAGLAGTAAVETDGTSGTKLSEEMLAALLGNTEALEELLKDDGMQEWLLQAAELLQGMMMLAPAAIQEGTTSSIDLTSSEEGSSQGDKLTLSQAQTVISAFLKAAQQQPEHPLLGQLQEKFAELLAKLPGAEQAKASELNHQTAASTKGEAATGEEASRISTGLPTASHAAREQRRESPSKETPALVMKLQTQVQSGQSHRLEMLAAKAPLILNLEQAAPETEAAALAGASVSAEGSEGFAAALHQQDSLRTAVAAKPDTAMVPMRAAAFAEDMTGFVLGKLKLTTGNGITEARIQLNPETLGQVDVKLTMQNGQLVAQFAAHTLQGKEMLESQLMQLRSSLQSQGIQVDRMEVTQSTLLSSGMFQDGRQQQSSRQSGQSERKGSMESQEEEFLTELDLRKEIRRTAEGGGFDVTA